MIIIVNAVIIFSFLFVKQSFTLLTNALWTIHAWIRALFVLSFCSYDAAKVQPSAVIWQVFLPEITAWGWFY